MKGAICIIVAFFLLTYALPASAQIRLGAIGGLNFSTMEAAYDEEITGRTVMGIGGVFSIGIFKNLRLKIEPMYLQKYAGIEATATQPAIDTELAFMECPILLKYSIGKTVQPYIIAGPSFGYLLRSELKTSLAGLEAKADVEDILRHLDVGMSAGAGFDIPIGPATIFVECRYTWELINLNKGGTIEFKMGPLLFPVESDENDVLKSRGLQLMMGFLIPL